LLRRARRTRQRWDVLAIVAALVLAAGAVQLFAGALDTGVTTDETVHTERLASWLNDGYYVPEGLLVDGRPDPDNDYSTPYVYGPAFAAVAHLANLIAGNEPIGGSSSSADAYAVRHLVVAALALIGALAVGAAVALLSRSRRFGLWAAAGLLAVPRWVGHGFFNLKDIPAATGYTLVTVALLFALLEDPGRPAGRGRRAAIALTLAAGIVIGAGTRTSLWVPFLCSLIGYAALRLGQWRLGGVSRARGTDLAVAAGAVAGAVAIAALYPEVARTPVTLLVESISNSSEYPYEGFTLTAGQLLNSHPPAWYLPVWLGASYPVLLGILGVVGAIAGLRALLVRGGRLDLGSIWRRRELGLLLVLLQALLLPIAAVADRVVMYGGVRQHLYVTPAIAILAGVGAARLWGWASAERAGRGWRAAATAGLCAALVLPMAESALLFPYDYAYVNPIAAIGGIGDRWETDYWFASAPAAIARVPRGVELRCSDFLVPGWAPDGEPDLHPCEGDQFEPYEDRRGTDVVSPPRPGERAVWVIARKRAANLVPSYCENAGDITRWAYGEEVVMSYVLRCDPGRVRRAEREAGG
jgi:hypothetical protein